MGVDHALAFGDVEGGSSFWCLVVDPQTGLAGVGTSLVNQLIDLFTRRDRRFLDLSVLHTNQNAIGLYEKLGFQQVTGFAVKHKNSINERLFIDTARGAGAQPVRPHHRRRGAAARHRRRDHRRAGRHLQAAPGRPRDAVPRVADRADRRRRNDLVPGQGADPARAWRRSACACRASRLPGTWTRTWLSCAEHGVHRGQAGARRTGPRHQRRRRAPRTNSSRRMALRAEGRRPRGARGAVRRARTCASSSSATRWWRLPSGARPR